MGLVPKCIKEETKMMMGLSYYRLMGLIITLMTGVSIGNAYVHAWFHLPFTATCVVFYIVLNLKVPENPNRRIWQGLILWISRLATPHIYLSVVGYAYEEARHET
jgi:hypothetical protein